MSDSPQSAPKDVDQGVQSPDGEEQMNETQDPQSAGLTYEFEVKEQDRWLPIANGTLSLMFWLSAFDLRGMLFPSSYSSYGGPSLPLILLLLREASASLAAFYQHRRATLSPPTGSCPTIRRPRRRKRFAFRRRRKPTMGLMLTYAILLQWLVS